MYLNLKSLLLKQLLDAPLSGAQLLDVALTSSDAVSALFPPDDESELRQTLLLFQHAGTITLDIYETGEMLLLDDVRAFVQVIRKHWHSHPCCLCRADQKAFETWRRAAIQEQQPLLLWNHLHASAGYHLCAPPLQGMEFSIFRELIRQGPASADELTHNPLIVSQRWPFNRPYIVERMMATGRPLPERSGPSPTDESAVRQGLQKLWRRRYVIEQAPGRFGVVRPTLPRRILK